MSLDSSIEESIMVEYSAHSRYSALSNVLGRPRAASGGQSLLGPLEEEGSEVQTPSLSQTTSDVENNNALSNVKKATLTSMNGNVSSNKRSQISSTNKNMNGGGILKPSRFTAESALPLRPPPPGLPPVAKGNIPPAPLRTKVKQQQPQRQHEIPVLSETTVLASVKSEETDSAFLSSLDSTNAASKTTSTVAVEPIAPNTPLADEPSQRTNSTFGLIPGNVPSETMHTSNLRTYDDSGFNAREADRVAAWAIHIALIFFCGLVIASVLISFTVIRKYGLVTMLGLLIMLVFVGFLAAFVDQTILSKNAQLRPIRQKIVAAIEATKGILVEEYHLLVQDWNEHLLLTQGQDQYQAYNEGDSTDANTRLPSPSVPHGRKRSKLFKIVKPFLGIKTRLFGNRRWSRQQPFAGGATSSNTTPTNANSVGHPQPQQQRTQGYQPPDKVTTGALA
jgi:hypothetical protein